MTTAGQGSAGNVIAALASLFFPGLGQLVQGRFLAAILFFAGAAVLWFISFGTLGWIMHLWASLNAALWKPA
jgi:TM2 domain-containing membrane protein YozV